MSCYIGTFLYINCASCYLLIVNKSKNYKNYLVTAVRVSISRTLIDSNTVMLPMYYREWLYNSGCENCNVGVVFV